MCNENCAICFESLSVQEGNFLSLKCKHSFHFSCIFQLMATNKEYNDKCPMCRLPLIDENTKIEVKNSSQTDLVQHLNYLYDENRNLAILNDRLQIYLFIMIFNILLLTIIHLVIYPSIIWFAIYIFEYIISSIFSIISASIGGICGLSYLVWFKIGNYVMSFLILGFFTVLTNNGNIPFMGNF